MTPKLGSALVGLAVLLLGTPSLKAQAQDVTAAFKIRGGLQVAQSQDFLQNRYLGFGFEMGLPMGPGRLTAEVGYQYKGGYLGQVDPFAVATQSGVTLANLDMDNDADHTKETINIQTRKNKLDGITLRLGYESEINSTYSWRAGIQIGGTKFSHQVIGQSAGTTSLGMFKTPYYTVESKNSLLPSPYAGITMKLDKESAVEFGVLLQSYEALDYQHIAGPGAEKHTLAKHGRVVPHVEIGYVLRF